MFRFVLKLHTNFENLELSELLKAWKYNRIQLSCKGFPHFLFGVMVLRAGEEVDLLFGV